MLIHCFWPLMRQPPSVFSARVRRLAASEPVSGSVSPKHPRISPLQSLGSHSCFWSSVPQRWIEEHTRLVWTETTVRADVGGPNAESVAAKASSSTDNDVPVAMEVVRNWAEYRSGNELVGSILLAGGKPVVETWILNVATVVTLAPAEVR